jgi:hypothetical protein
MKRRSFAITIRERGDVFKEGELTEREKALNYPKPRKCEG